jgi:hypothetical protein
MAFSYSGDPASSPRDAVRFEIQDTNSKSPLLQNAEIEYALAQEAPNEPPSEGEVLSAAARCMESLARLFSAQADTELGSLKVTYTKQAKGYTERAKELRLRAQGMHAPWTGGTSVAEKRAREAEPDRVQHAFSRGQFDNPSGAGTLPGGARRGEGGES